VSFLFCILQEEETMHALQKDDVSVMFSLPRGPSSFPSLPHQNKPTKEISNNIGDNPSALPLLPLLFVSSKAVFFSFLYLYIHTIYSHQSPLPFPLFLTISPSFRHFFHHHLPLPHQIHQHGLRVLPLALQNRRIRFIGQRSTMCKV
jgi:hypothetical protein